MDESNAIEVFEIKEERMDDDDYIYNLTYLNETPEPKNGQHNKNQDVTILGDIVSWSHADSILLMNLFREYSKRIGKDIKTKQHMFDVITDELAKHGCLVNSEKVRNRYKSWARKAREMFAYKRRHYNTNKTFPYEEELSEIYGDIYSQEETTKPHHYKDMPPDIRLRRSERNSISLQEVIRAHPPSRANPTTPTPIQIERTRIVYESPSQNQNKLSPKAANAETKVLPPPGSTSQNERKDSESLNTAILRQSAELKLLRLEKREYYRNMFETNQKMLELKTQANAHRAVQNRLLKKQVELLETIASKLH